LMSNETELHLADSIQFQCLEIIKNELKSEFLQLNTDQLASILISSLGAVCANGINDKLSGITRESYVKILDLIHDCAISFWDLNEDKE
jgi:hypothetical protein